MSNMISISSSDGGQFSAYKALPPSGKGPGLVLLQYIFGVNKVMRDLADHYANLGYVTIVPDLFWRQEPNIRMADEPSKTTPEEFNRALALEKAYDDKAGIQDLKDIAQYMRQMPESEGRFGTVGFCLGGRLAYLMAAHTDVDCAVSYYGVHIENYLQEGLSISQPMLMHMAGADFLVTPPIREQIMNTLQDKENIEFVIYPEANHAFALPGGMHYHASSALLANERTESFLANHLKD